MNASAPTLDREGEVESKIRKVSTFSRGARVVCAALFGFGLVGTLGMLIFSVLGIFLPLPDDGSGLTAEQKIWGLPIAAAVMGTWLAIVFQLYRLFGDLASGAIYTPQNVRRVRRVGLLWLLLAFLGLLVTVAAQALPAFGVRVPLETAFTVPWSELLATFAAAGLILLVSWIMDVGLSEKDHADALRRDADLVI